MAQNTAHVGDATIVPDGKPWSEVSIQREWGSGTTRSVEFGAGEIVFCVDGEEVHREAAAAFFDQFEEEEPDFITYIGYGGDTATKDYVRGRAEEYDADGVFVNSIGNYAIYFGDRKPPEGFARDSLSWHRAEPGDENYERAMELDI